MREGGGKMGRHIARRPGWVSGLQPHCSVVGSGETRANNTMAVGSLLHELSQSSQLYKGLATLPVFFKNIYLINSL